MRERLEHTSDAPNVGFPGFGLRLRLKPPQETARWCWTATSHFRHRSTAGSLQTNSQASSSGHISKFSTIKKSIRKHFPSPGRLLMLYYCSNTHHSSRRFHGIRYEVDFLVDRGCVVPVCVVDPAGDTVTVYERITNAVQKQWIKAGNTCSIRCTLKKHSAFNVTLSNIFLLIRNSYRLHKNQYSDSIHIENKLQNITTLIINLVRILR